MKRLNGQGSISPRKDGRWSVRWTEHVGGKSVSRTAYAPTRPEAEKKLREILRRLEGGQTGVDSRTPFKAVGERWRRTAGIAQGISTRSMDTYSGVLRLHINPVIGHLPIGEVKPSHVIEVLTAMDGKGLSKSYQHQAHKVISGVFKMAMADELVIRNPTMSVKAPRGGHKPKVVPGRDQVLAMIEHAPDERMTAFVTVLAYSGLRIGEALALSWSDWDGESTIRIRNGKGGKARAVPVPAPLQDALKAWRHAQKLERMKAVWWDTEADWILSTDVGTRWDPHNARKRFRPIAGAAGVPGATPHSLRHAGATILLEEGVPMRVVAELLGHSSTRITEDIYSHVTARLVAEAATALERALGGKVTDGERPAEQV